MTSNLGTEFIKKGGTLGFLQPESSDEERESHDKIDKALKSTFRPEFLNRIDEIIMFSTLTREDMTKIVDLQMKEIQDRLQEQDLKAKLTEEARLWLAEEGYDENFGARPLKRILQKHVESPLSISLLAGEFKEGDSMLVDYDAEKKQIIFKKEAVLEKTKKESK